MMGRLFVLGLLASSATAGSARADGPREAAAAAKPHVDAGVAAYQAGHYDVASREFEQAYAIDPDPTLLYAWAQALRLGGHCADAITTYQRYLASDPTEAQRAAARTGIELCKQATPKPPPEKSPPPPPQPPEPAMHEPTVRWYRDGLGGALTIAGVAATVTGATFLVLAGSSEDAALDAEFRDDFVDLLDEATLRRRVGFIALGVGGALVVGGVVRYASIWDSKQVTVATTGTSLFIAGRF